jgi:hypothetical protein
MFYYLVFGLVQVALASFDHHNFTITYSAETDEMQVSCYVGKNTWFAIGFGKGMDNGGGIVF